jgi:hypothetical protein
MLLKSYLAAFTTFVVVTSALPMPPKLSLNTNVQATGPPTPNENWPKTITNGELRQKNPDESPTTLSGPQIGPSHNYNPGQPHHNSPASKGKRGPEPGKKKPDLSINTNVQSTGPPTPNENWPKTITNGELRQKNPDESPTTLSGPQIGPSQNYNPGQAHPNSPASPHHRSRRGPEPGKKPSLSLNTNVQSTGPPTPNENWPKTITNGELRQKNPDESPTTLSGPQIGPSQNYNPGQAHHNTPVSPHHH